jgi:serine protease
MLRALISTAVTAVLALAAATPAVAAPAYVPGEVLVKSGGETKSVAVKAGDTVREAASQLRKDPDVAYAVPNYIAHASFTPNDPNFGLQWNLNSPYGINAPAAWDIARARGFPGGKGVVVAVLDTGVAYQRFHRFRRVPDLKRFVAGYDFVDGDRHPNDLNGHGTHVAGTIAQSTDNGVATAGVAYRARIMPVRVLDADGAGDTLSIARGIRYAARKGAKVINLSLEFDSSVRASQIPDIVSALRYAKRRGALVVAAAGNQADTLVAYPARAKGVLAVAAITIRGCQADYSNSGVDVDLAAPGGGVDAVISDPQDLYSTQVCNPNASGNFIFQQTFTSSVRRFGLPRGYEGTSMAAPHVSGTAALIIASKRLGPRPSPLTLERHLELTARDAGRPGFDPRYGNGLLDAAAALR